MYISFFRCTFYHILSLLHNRPQRLKFKSTALHQVRSIGEDIPRMWACLESWLLRAIMSGMPSPRGSTLHLLTNGSGKSPILLRVFFFLCGEFLGFFELKIQFQSIQRIFYKINLQSCQILKIQINGFLIRLV